MSNIQCRTLLDYTLVVKKEGRLARHTRPNVFLDCSRHVFSPPALGFPFAISILRRTVTGCVFDFNDDRYTQRSWAPVPVPAIRRDSLDE
jgi:hypothetical protein